MLCSFLPRLFLITVKYHVSYHIIRYKSPPTQNPFGLIYRLDKCFFDFFIPRTRHQGNIYPVKKYFEKFFSNRRIISESKRKNIYLEWYILEIRNIYNGIYNGIYRNIYNGLEISIFCSKEKHDVIPA